VNNHGSYFQRKLHLQTAETDACLTSSFLAAFSMSFNEKHGVEEVCLHELVILFTNKSAPQRKTRIIRRSARIIGVNLDNQGLAVIKVAARGIVTEGTYLLHVEMTD